MEFSAILIQTMTSTALTASWLLRIWQFARPHTIIGTSLSVWALAAIALAAQPTVPTVSQVMLVLMTWLACLAGNLYIVGLNQLTDIPIDRINKPHLPVAAGDLSEPTARRLVLVAGGVAIALGAWLGQWLLFTVVASLLLGTAYSLPPLRLKRWPLLAAFCILVVRGVIINFGLFLHFESQWLHREFLTPNIIILSSFIFLFSIAIALFKDVPDTLGDREYKIKTLTLLLGKEAVFQITRGVMAASYAAMIGIGYYHLGNLNGAIALWGHGVLFLLLWWRSQFVDLDDSGAIQSFYQFIWRLFFVEYLLFPLACWL